MVYATTPRATTIQEIFDEAIRADGAAKGTLQLFNPALNGLEIIAHCGFNETFLETFRIVRADEPSVCGRALRFKRRVTISDIRADLFFWPYLTIAAEAGIRAVQSTPIMAEDGAVIGVLSTHFANVHRLSNQAAAILDHCAARLAGMMVEKN
jgi:GAF domain-containing protein